MKPMANKPIAAYGGLVFGAVLLISLFIPMDTVGGDFGQIALNYGLWFLATLAAIYILFLFFMAKHVAANISSNRTARDETFNAMKRGLSNVTWHVENFGISFILAGGFAMARRAYFPWLSIPLMDKDLFLGLGVLFLALESGITSIRIIRADSKGN